MNAYFDKVTAGTFRIIEQNKTGLIFATVFDLEASYAEAVDKDEDAPFFMHVKVRKVLYKCAEFTANV